MEEIRSKIKRCPRCQSLLFYEAKEAYCLICGWRPLAITVKIKNGRAKSPHQIPVDCKLPEDSLYSSK